MNGLEIVPLDQQANKRQISTVPKPSFSLLINAPKGGGKTTLILNMLLNKNLLRYKFNKIFYFSPTARYDSKTQILKSEEILERNKKLFNLLKRNYSKKLDPIGEKLETNTLQDIPVILDESNFINTLDMDIINDVMKENKLISETFGKEYSNKILFIFDDLASETKLFNSKQFKNMMFLSRHFNISSIIITQNYHSIPKPIRLNMNQIILFECNNVKELDSIYTENNSGKSFKDFLELYRSCIDEDYGFLVINYQVPKKYRFANQFKNFIT